MKNRTFISPGSAAWITGPRAWRVQLVEPGDRYGRENVLTNDGDEPLVEFYDLTHFPERGGQFVTRYYAKTLLEGEQCGLILDGSVKPWRIESGTMEEVRGWIRESLPEAVA